MHLQGTRYNDRVTHRKPSCQRLDSGAGYASDGAYPGSAVRQRTELLDSLNHQPPADSEAFGKGSDTLIPRRRRLHLGRGAGAVLVGLAWALGADPSAGFALEALSLTMARAVGPPSLGF